MAEEKKKTISIIKEVSTFSSRDQNPSSTMKDLKANHSFVIKSRKSTLFDSKEDALPGDLVGFCIMGLLSNGISSCTLALAKLLAHNLMDGSSLKCMNGNIIVTLALYFFTHSLTLFLSKIFCTEMPPFFTARLCASQIYEVLGINLVSYENSYVIHTGIICIAFSYAIQESLYLQYGQYFLGYESEGFSITSDVSSAIFVTVFTLIFSYLNIKYFYIYLFIKILLQYITHYRLIKHPLTINQFRMDSWKKRKNSISPYRNKLNYLAIHSFQWPPFTLKEQLEIWETKCRILIPTFFTFLMGNLGMILHSEMFKFNPLDEIVDFMKFISAYFCGLACGRLTGLIEHYLQLPIIVLWFITFIDGITFILGFILIKQNNFYDLLFILFFLGLFSGISFDFTYNVLVIKKTLKRPYQKSGEIIILSELYSIAAFIAALIALVVESLTDFPKCNFRKIKICHDAVAIHNRIK